MIFRLILFCALLFPSVAFSWNWSVYGGLGMKVYNAYPGDDFMPKTMCTSTGLVLWMGCGGWVRYSVNDKPVYAAVAKNSDTLLVIMGDDSSSYGIYAFSYTSLQFTKIISFDQPKFIVWQPAFSTFIAGGAQGLLLSENGNSWQAVDTLENVNCTSIVYTGNKTILVGDNQIIFSTDLKYWETRSGANYCDLAINAKDELYGVMGGYTKSSGLYRSTDYGQKWNVIFWSLGMTSVAFDRDGNCFAGWNSKSEPKGIAFYSPERDTLIFMSNGLPNLNINKINPYSIDIDAELIVCTDSGAFLLSDYSADIASGMAPATGKNPDGIHVTAARNTLIVDVKIVKANNRLELTDLSGRIILSVVLKPEPVQEIRVPVYSQGIYLAMVYNDSESVSQKVFLRPN